MIPRQWRSYSLARQIGNIGAELVRARQFEQRGKQESRDHALRRALELLAATLADSRWRGRRKEPARLRELTAAWFTDADAATVRPEQLIAYCMPFAVQARAHHLKPTSL